MADRSVVFGALRGKLDYGRAPNLHPDDVHIFKNMQMVIMGLQAFVISMLLNWVNIQLGFYWASYYKFGPPVSIRGDTVTSTAAFWVLWTLFLVDRAIASLSGATIGGWRTRVRGSKAAAALPPNSTYGYWTIMWIALVDLAVGWLRMAITVVFIYSQISFALAFMIGDLFVQCFLTVCYVEKSRRIQRGEHVPGRFEHMLAKISPLYMSLIEVFVSVPILITAFYVSGFAHSEYFDLGPPIVAFGERIGADWAYALLVVYGFIDQLIASTVNAAFGGWDIGELHNNAVADLHMSPAKARGIFYTRLVCQWIRDIIVINLTLSQFIFTVAFFLADLIVTFFSVYKYLVDVSLDKTQFANGMQRMAQALPSKAWALAVLVIEIIILFIVAGAVGLFQTEYFAFPPPLVLFAAEIEITKEGYIVMLAVYVVIDRIVATLTRDITTPWIITVVIGGNPHGKHYGGGDVMIVAVNAIYKWLRRVLAYNFIIADFLFVAISAVTDIFVSALITERYLDYKAEMRQHFRDFKQMPEINETETEQATSELEGLVGAVRRSVHSPGEEYLSDDDKDMFAL